ncbi:response regulator [Phenylobacterium sp.]|uniref:hybrid sensor histidine kinase/response regulator n=1 Tax=Phenylobacterium sp. TaxID=1871053 RepID=UPI0027302CBA|nr:response regulator [Phenylobacterium sp.]MDP1619202.1 response regulator [Phenylobacterium sp.]MDP1985903.1 response regulator [Phenylobacterium sp.]
MIIAPSDSADIDASPRRSPEPVERAGGRVCKPGLALILDEAAVAVRGVLPARLGLDLLAAVTALMILDVSAVATWLAGILALEVWSWSATRPAARGEAITWRVRRSFLANYIGINVAWIVLGALFLASGTVEGIASGGILLVAVATVFVMLFHNTPLIFLVAGASPAMAALAVFAVADGRDWQQMTAVWLALTLAMIFSLGRALDTPSAQVSQRRLNESLHQFQVLAENVTDIIVRSDLRGLCNYVSPGSLLVLGYQPDELIGTFRAELVHPDDRPELSRALRRMLASPDRPEVLTLRVQHKDGHWVWLQTSAKLVFENGAPVGVIDVNRDVTERIAAEDALRAAKAEADAANQAKAEFLANVSHEIRTPMNGVLGALHLLERESISLEGRELMRQASECGRMLSQLLNDVLDFSKIEAGQLDLAPEPMHVGEALKTVVALLDAEARAKGVDLRCEIAGEDLWIDADPVRVRQAMFNLIGNAVKFTGQGHVAARLAVSRATAGRCTVVLEVEDTGIGLSEEARRRLFERFSQAETNIARRFGGAGLGLSITQALARMMGGEITYTSVEGEGSTFCMAFDAAAADAVSVPADEGELLDGVNILLVEDNVTNRLVARTLLTRLGAVVVEAADGVEGLSAARAGAFDLILMDIQMPHMSGVEATRAIRGLKGPTGQVPIIGLTANVMVHQRAEYLAAGMNGVVAKPIDAARLLGEISRLLMEEDERQAG